MSDEHRHETARTDIGSTLGALADGLRVRAAAVRGIGAEAGDTGDSHESRRASALAGELEAAAERLDVLRGALCLGCEIREVIETVSVTEEKTSDTRGRAPR